MKAIDGVTFANDWSPRTSRWPSSRRCAPDDHIAYRGGKVTVQSFEVGNLKVLHHELPGVPLVQLFDAKTNKPGDVLAAGGSTTYGDLATRARPR